MSVHMQEDEDLHRRCQALEDIGHTLQAGEQANGGFTHCPGTRTVTRIKGTRFLSIQPLDPWPFLFIRLEKTIFLVEITSR
jgi:hypothetical protein